MIRFEAVADHQQSRARAARSLRRQIVRAAEHHRQEYQAQGAPQRLSGCGLRQAYRSGGEQDPVHGFPGRPDTRPCDASQSCDARLSGAPLRLLMFLKLPPCDPSLSGEIVTLIASPAFSVRLLKPRRVMKLTLVHSTPHSS